MNYSLFISCPRNMEYLLEDEMNELGLAVEKVSPMGVFGNADLKTLYNICLCSRIANRAQLILFSGDVFDEDSLNQLCSQYNWTDVFTVDKTIAIEFHGQSSFINNTMYGAQIVKDGIVDFFKQHEGARPDVDKKTPDIRLHAYLKHDELTVSLDLLGYSMHQRGYRLIAGNAPLKENIAAAILIRAGWPALAEKGYSFVDPFCGSGTFLIEAAMIASNTAPGLLRKDQALKNWQAHDDELWQEIIKIAESKRRPINNTIIGFDYERDVLEIATENIDIIGMSESITVKQQAIKDFQAQPGPGLLVCNPPYGERLKDPLTLLPLYQDLGRALFNHCQNWQAAVLTSNPTLAYAIGLRSDKGYNFYNGPLKVKLYCFNVDENNQLKINSKRRLNENSQALYNRLSKNKKHLAKWLKRNNLNCYRLYDADLPEYAFAVDLYGDWVHVQEYAPPKEIPENKAKNRVSEMLQVLAELLNIPATQIVLKQRKRQKGAQQYQAFDNKNKTFTVTEGDARLKVNLHDYLDTGLFLDHRPIRLQFANTLRDKKFLNCFCYTATASVHAALGGATTYNIDLSNTYLDWAEENFRINNLKLRDHEFIQADCLQWLADCDEKFDVIFLDPPSFSNSKRMQTTLDIQRDHQTLIELAVDLLEPNGILYFSTNLKKFKLAPSVTEQYNTQDITQQTLDEDFKRSKHIHNCFKIQRRHNE